MSFHNPSRIVQIHTRKNISSESGEMIWYSVVQAKSEDGCLDCQLQWDATEFGHWVIRGTWRSEDSMRLSFERYFQPAIEHLIAREALLSIKVLPDESTGGSLRHRSAPKIPAYPRTANWG